MNNSKPYSWNIKDLGKGAFLAVIIAVLGGLQQLRSSSGFNLGEWDWGFIMNLALTAFTGYMAKQFVSDRAGTPFGSVK